MAINSGSDIRDVWKRLIAAVGSTEEALADVNSPVRHKFMHSKAAADSAANSTYTSSVEFPTDTQLKFENGKVKLVPEAALTADASNYATIQLVYNDGAGGANTVIGSVTTAPVANSGTGNWTAGTAIDIPVTAANALVASGKNVAVNITKAGTGVAVPAFRLFAKAYSQ